jgi:flagellar motor switch protein FliN/FliY
VAHFANTQRIRTDKDTIASEIPDLPYNAMTVRNYAVSMSGGTANIEVPMPGDAQCAKAKGGLANAACTRAYITPASLDSLRLPALPGNLVDFKILSSTVDASGFAKGSALVLWQHSMLGEDQDQDHDQAEDNAVIEEAANHHINPDVLQNISVAIKVEVGRTKMKIRDLLRLTQGSVVELERIAGEPLDLLVNDTVVAQGEVVLVNDRYGIRLTRVVPASERMRNI